jgi:GNAT superfamily N-acetyltransferase
MPAQPGQPRPGEAGLGEGVVPACPADLDSLSRVIADAFFDLPPSQWLVPDPDARREIFPAYFRLYVEDALANGVVHTTSDRAAVALWFRVGQRPAVRPPGYGEWLAAVAGARIDRFLVFDEALDRLCPAGMPHHHLAILAVRPDRQAQGCGTMLLDAYHQLLDHGAQEPAHLEAADLRARKLYLRHGYADRASLIQLPEGPLMYPMLRERRTSAPEAGG